MSHLFQKKLNVFFTNQVLSKQLWNNENWKDGI